MGHVHGWMWTGSLGMWVLLGRAVKWDRAFKYVEGTLGDIDDEGLVVLLEGPGVGSQACLKRDPSQRTCGSIHCHCMI